MTDKEADTLKTIAKMLRMVLSPDLGDGEWQNSYSRLMATLKEFDPGGHKITALIEQPGLAEEVLREKIKEAGIKFYEAGRVKGRAEEAASRPRDGSTLGALLNVGNDKGFNGYTWRAIAEHCLINIHRIHREWAEQFIQSVARQLASPYASLSEKQKAKLAEVFEQYFNGRI